jgi:hypothetical protein
MAFNQNKLSRVPFLVIRNDVGGSINPMKVRFVEKLVKQIIGMHKVHK